MGAIAEDLGSSKSAKLTSLADTNVTIVVWNRYLGLKDIYIDVVDLVMCLSF